MENRDPFWFFFFSLLLVLSSNNAIFSPQVLIIQIVICGFDFPLFFFVIPVDSDQDRKFFFSLIWKKKSAPQLRVDVFFCHLDVTNDYTIP